MESTKDAATVEVEPNTPEAIAFLKRWPTTIKHLTAIHVDPVTHEKGLIESRAFSVADLDNGAAALWINSRQGKANLYFSVNELMEPINRRAKKTDIKTVVAFHVDIDVPAGEDQEAVAAGLVESVKEYTHEPSAIISSGGGVQAFWVLPESDRVPVEGDLAKAEAAECYTRALEAEFGEQRGAKADSCFNVDRIMRLAGTINVPDIKKLKKGRGPALARLVQFSDLKHPIGAFTPAAVKGAAGSTALAKGPSAAVNARLKDGRAALVNWGEVETIFRTVTVDALEARGLEAHAVVSLRHGNDLQRLHEEHARIGHRVADGPYESFSPVSLAISTALVRLGLSNEEAASILIDPLTPGNEHVRKALAKSKDSARRAVERTLGRAILDIDANDRRAAATAAGIPMWVECADRNGLCPLPSHRNAKLAIEGLGIRLRYDVFRDKVLGEYLGESEEIKVLVGEFSDNVLHRIRDMIEARFNFDPGERHVFDAAKSIALANCFNPITEMLDEAAANWDGVPRLDTMAQVYFGAEPTPLHLAIIRTHILASVARAYSPGCKYDCICVLEGVEGTGKSSAIKILAGGDFFTDQRLLGLDDKTVAETIRGMWMVELADLAGMMRSEVEQSKAMASRTSDKVRKAFGKVVETVHRTCTMWGSTNDNAYLQSQTGNRRWLPVLTGTIDLEALKRDRLQILGEAAKRYHAKESWTLDPALWDAAAAAQEERRVTDPWEAPLADLPFKVVHQDHDRGRMDIQVIHTIGGQDRVSAGTVLEYYLKVPPAQQQAFHVKRVHNGLRRAGWTYSDKPMKLPGGKLIRGFYRPAVAPPAPEPTAADKAKAEQSKIPF